MIIQFFLRARPTAHFPIVTPVKTSGGKTDLLTKIQLCYDLASYFQFIVSLSEFEAIKNNLAILIPSDTSSVLVSNRIQYGKALQIPIITN